MILRRSVALLATLLFVATACLSETAEQTTGGGDGTPAPTQTAGGSGQGSGGGSGGGGSSPATAAPSNTKQPSAPTAAPPQTFDDRGSLGTAAHFYLNAKRPKLIVEIDAVKGWAPDQAALDLLKTRINSLVDKPSGVQFLPVEIIDETRGTWSIDAMKAFEEAHRDRYSNANEIVLYISYLDGAPQSGAIGVAYSATACTVFRERIEGAATVLVPGDVIERAVLVHEVGHVFSLVNIGYESPRKREDADHPGHSNNQDSVMYWAVDNVGVVSLLGGNTAPPTQFDANDRADLADVKSGKLRPGG